MLSNTLRLNFWYLKIMHILHPRYHLKIIGHILKNKQKCVCFHEIIRLIIMKTEMKIKNRPHRYDIHRPRSRDGHKYSKYKKCLSKMMHVRIKQHLSSIWSLIHEKVKQHSGWVDNKLWLYKSVYLTQNHNVRKCQEFSQINHVQSSVSHLSKKWSSSSPQWAAFSELIQHCCALTSRADVCRVWWTVTLICRNIQVATITIDCIQLRKDIWELAQGKWADVSTTYITHKMNENRIWFNLKNLSCNTVMILTDKIWMTIKDTP